MPSQNQAPTINYTNESDKFNVMAKEAFAKLDDYNKKIRSIDVSLNNAKASLQATPGVEMVLQAIDQSIQENYRRGYAYQDAVKARSQFMNTIATALSQFQQTVNALPEPQNTPQQLRIGDNQNSQQRPENGNFQQVK